eukprot:comp19256_c0_seq1/m.36123 comp19256_c0_seq1/g.36123  ORF comp19256_c0_seq1/g.36123 comp19256_c0_seq1/m.36123 type:complete len:293 (-) comp19256_c0_seq1:117-995(-)
MFVSRAVATGVVCAAWLGAVLGLIVLGRRVPPESVEFDAVVVLGNEGSRLHRRAMFGVDVMETRGTGDCVLVFSGGTSFYGRLRGDQNLVDEASVAYNYVRSQLPRLADIPVLRTSFVNGAGSRANMSGEDRSAETVLKIENSHAAAAGNENENENENEQLHVLEQRERQPNTTLILLEDQSVSTYQNAVFTLRALEKLYHSDLATIKRTKHIAVVTDSFHSLRTEWLFRDLGLVHCSVVTVPLAHFSWSGLLTHPRLIASELYWATREFVGIFWHNVQALRGRAPQWKGEL